MIDQLILILFKNTFSTAEVASNNRDDGHEQCIEGTIPSFL